jgi:hypothetical protein
MVCKGRDIDLGIMCGVALNECRAVWKSAVKLKEVYTAPFCGLICSDPSLRGIADEQVSGGPLLGRKIDTAWTPTDERSSLIKVWCEICDATAFGRHQAQRECSA